MRGGLAMVQFNMGPPQKKLAKLQLSSPHNPITSKNLNLGYIMQVIMLYHPSYSQFAIFNWWTYNSQNKATF
jgi:hypothetical protein